MAAKKKTVKKSTKMVKSAVKGIKAGAKRTAKPKAPKATKAATHEVSCSSSSGCGGMVDANNNLVNKPSAEAAPEVMSGDEKGTCGGASGCGNA